MNIYEKLQEARIKLSQEKMKKSGYNKFAGYNYFELGDFLPSIQKIFNELKVFGAVRFTPELAILDIINSENPEEVITFTSPFGSASLKGCHDVQNIGAVQTYQRRYLYVTALEIVEHDALDAVTGEPEKEDKLAVKNIDPGLWNSAVVAAKGGRYKFGEFWRGIDKTARASLGSKLEELAEHTAQAELDKCQ